MLVIGKDLFDILNFCVSKGMKEEFLIITAVKKCVSKGFKYISIMSGIFSVIIHLTKS